MTSKKHIQSPIPPRGIAEEVFMEQHACHEILDEHFMGWYGDRSAFPLPSRIAEGLLTWVWDMREQTLQGLEQGDHETIATLAREARECVEQEDSDAARAMREEDIEEWIEDHSEALADAIRESLED